MNIRVVGVKVICFLSCSILAFGFMQSASAEVPEAPIILEFGAGGCTPAPEICGDGIDQDCNGSDLPCENAPGAPIAGNSGVDADADGYHSDADCDDTDRTVYHGISVACSSNCGTGTKTCQVDGSFNTCTCTPLCEASGSGRCFYISKLTGSDSNQGTFSSPWRTLAPINNTTTVPTSVQLRAGDVVYLMSGTYDKVTVYGQFSSVLSISEAYGEPGAPITIKAYPGSRPVIAPRTQAFCGLLHSVSNISIEGIELTRCWHAGLWFAVNPRNIELRNLWVHNVDGVDNDNISGLMFNESVGVKIHHSVIHDNFDRTNADTGGRPTENSRNIVFFRGGDVEVSYNSIFNSAPHTSNETGACIGYKHPAETGTFRLHHNIIRNCFHAAVQSYTPNAHFHHNLIMDSDKGFYVTGHGAALDLTDYIIEHNTIVNTRPLVYKPSGALSFGGDAGPLTYRRNIATFTGPYNADQGGIISIDPYGHDVYYDQVVPGDHLRFSQNCYYNRSGTVSFGLFSASEQAIMSKGALYSLSQWRGFGYDLNSVVTNPQLNSAYVPQNAACASYGVFGN